jgi:uncharacterized repeat protein (TIGR01451 family)
MIGGSINSSASGTYSFNVTATDTGSGYSSAAQAFSIDVTPFVVNTQNVAVSVTSLPAGLQVTVDGTSYTTPQKFTWVQGSTHTLATTSPQGTGTRNVFASWSDGGAQSHTVAAPSAATTYTASFSTQYLLTTAVSPAGYGTIAISPTSTGGYYGSGTPVQITAMATAGHNFSGFSGDLTGTANPQTLAMSAPHSVTTNFYAPPKFSLTVRHNGTFTRGEQNATYTITVSNTSATATTGAVTVSETLSSQMTLVSMAGTGWTCASHSCARSDSLAGGSAYPSITVTVNIASSAGSQLVNSVTVSGGGAALP